MEILRLVISLFLLLAGTCVLLFLAWAVYVQAAQWFFGGSGSLKLKRAQKRLDEIDRLVAADNFKGALDELRKAAWIEPALTREAVTAAREHNQNVLSRALVVSEELGGRAENIAQVEHLFMEHAELQLLQIKSNEAYRKLRDKREQAGKAVPSWGKTDFETRLREVKKELARTTDELRRELDKLFNSIETPSSANVTYH